MGKQVKAVAAPAGFSLSQSDDFPHLMGYIKQGKAMVPYFAPKGERTTAAAFTDARFLATVAVVTQFFTTSPMSPEERVEFTSATRWNLKSGERAAFEALVTYYLLNNSGENIEAANTWYLKAKAMRATDTTLNALAIRVAGWLKHHKKPVPSQFDRFLKQYEAGEKVRKSAKKGTKAGGAQSGDAKSDDAMLKPSESSLVYTAVELVKQASLQLDAITNGKVSKAQKDALTAKLREILGVLEPITTK